MERDGIFGSDYTLIEALVRASEAAQVRGFTFHPSTYGVESHAVFSDDAPRVLLSSPQFQRLARIGAIEIDHESWASGSACGELTDFAFMLAKKWATRSVASGTDLNPNPAMGSESLGAKMTNRDPTRIFVVYGHNTAAYSAMFQFLKSLSLDPRDFDEIRNELSGAPFIGHIVKAGIERAQATVVMFTSDEFSMLRPGLERPHDPPRDRQRWQARPNVLLGSCH